MALTVKTLESEGFYQNFAKQRTHRESDQFSSEHDPRVSVSRL